MNASVGSPQNNMKSPMARRQPAWIPTALELASRPALAALAGLFLNAPVAAFEMESFVIAPGGGVATQDSWELHATLGQPVVGTSQGNAFELRAGFWAAGFVVEPPVDALFADRFQETAQQQARTQPAKQPKRTTETATPRLIKGDQ